MKNYVQVATEVVISTGKSLNPSLETNKRILWKAGRRGASMGPSQRDCRCVVELSREQASAKQDLSKPWKWISIPGSVKDGKQM